ncbi:hypothetical protein ACFL27_08835, partial [candidate division CSSED10-310 bacterium]
MGADAVFVDLPLLISLECVTCGNCLNSKPCPQDICNSVINSRRRHHKHDLNSYKWGAMRIINLLLSWRDQLLEVLGAGG